MPKTGDLLTGPQVSVLVGKSVRTIQRLAGSGELPYAQKLPGPNGAFLFRREDVDRLFPEAAAAVVRSA